MAGVTVFTGVNNASSHMRLAALVAALLPATPRAASFVYPDFNDTQGLVFNRDAATTSCGTVEVQRAAASLKFGRHALLLGCADLARN